MNFYELLKNREKFLGKKYFLKIDDENYTYSDFLNIVDSCKISSRNSNLFIFEKSFLDQAIKFFAAQKMGKKPILLHEGTDREDLEFFQGNENDVLGVMTSGTTGKPKILYRTYESWANFFPEQNKIFKITEDGKLFMHGSLSFTGNLNALLSVLYAGGEIITSQKFSPRIWQNLIINATNIYLVPTKLRLLADGEPLKNILGIFTGSQVLTKTQSLALMKKFPAAEIILYYGATEVNYVTYKKICTNNVDDVNNLGKKFFGVNVEIRDGMIYVDNNFHVSGIKMPYTVGDFGHFDSDGNLIFEGRGEDFINRGGVKINAIKIELKLLSIPEVEAAAVVKFRDEIRGEDFKVYLVAPKKIRPLVRKIFLPSEMPSKIIFVDSIPLNDRGKVDKSKLK